MHICESSLDNLQFTPESSVVLASDVPEGRWLALTEWALRGRGRHSGQHLYQPLQLASGQSVPLYL